MRRDILDLGVGTGISTVLECQVQASAAGRSQGGQGAFGTVNEGAQRAGPSGVESVDLDSIWPYRAGNLDIYFPSVRSSDKGQAE